MNLPDFEEVLNHFNINTSDIKEKEEVFIFQSSNIEKEGKSIAFYLAKGKGRATIDYDPAFPYAVLRISTDTPNISAIFKVTCDGGQYSFEPVTLIDSKD